MFKWLSYWCIIFLTVVIAFTPELVLSFKIGKSKSQELSDADIKGNGHHWSLSDKLHKVKEEIIEKAVDKTVKHIVAKLTG
nr:hypothetical transcript [Hymenolepis microstoma]